MERVTMTPITAFRELLRQGYTLSPTTRTEVHEHRAGAQAITYGHRLLVAGGPGPLEGELREAVKAHQPILLAAACVIRPPVGWLAYLVERTRVGRATIPMLAANVASFIGHHPAHDGPRFEAIIEEALR